MGKVGLERIGKYIFFLKVKLFKQKMSMVKKITIFKKKAKPK